MSALKLPWTLEQRLRRIRRTRRAARLESARSASLWIAGTAAFAAIMVAFALTGR